MSIQKLYRKATPNKAGAKTNSGAIKMDVTWHREFDETPDKRGENFGFSKTGKGAEVKVTKTPIALGDGTYANHDALTLPELDEIKSNNVKRLIEPRFNTALDALKGLVNAIKNPMTKLDQDQATTIASYLRAKVEETEAALFNVKEKKNGKVTVEL